MIRFPSRHIADSVAQRIMDVEKKINGNSVAAQGARLEQAMQQPVADVAPIDGIETAIPARALDL